MRMVSGMLSLEALLSFLVVAFAAVMLLVATAPAEKVSTSAYELQRAGDLAIVADTGMLDQCFGRQKTDLNQSCDRLSGLADDFEKYYGRKACFYAECPSSGAYGVPVMPSGAGCSPDDFPKRVEVERLLPKRTWDQQPGTLNPSSPVDEFCTVRVSVER